MKILFSVLLIGIIGIILGTAIYVSAEEELVPAWIKNSAGWWSKGLVADSEFINSMQWLVGEGIISIPQNEDTSEKKYVVGGMTYDIKTKKVTKKDKFSIWQPTNWERQQQELMISSNRVGSYNSMIEHGTITNEVTVDFTVAYRLLDLTRYYSDIPVRISVAVNELREYKLCQGKICTPLEEHIEWMIKEIHPFFGGLGGSWKELESGDTVIDGEEAKWIISISNLKFKEIGKPDSTLTMKNKMINVLHQGDVYTISFNAEEKNYDDYIMQFEEIVKTFKFLE